MKPTTPHPTRQKDDAIVLINIVFAMLIALLVAHSLTQPVHSEVASIFDRAERAFQVVAQRGAP